MQFEEKQLLCYAVTDRSFCGRQTLYEQIEDALLGGVTMLQLREKNLTEEDFFKEAVEVTKLCHRYGVPCIINDNVTIALRSHADGVHLGISDAPVKEVRALAGKNFIIGATAKTVEQARAAEAAGADYLGVGAVFPSPTKQNAIRITAEQMKEICASVSIPAAAIGGICASNIEQLDGSGVRGIAVVSSLFGAEDIRGTAGILRKKMEALLAVSE